MSKRNFKRQVLNQSLKYQKRFDSVEREEEEVQCEGELQCEEEEVHEHDIESEKCVYAEENGLRFKLKDWFIEEKPSRKCLEKLLKILNEEGLNVPLSAEALIGKRDEVVIKKFSDGNYCHLGLENQLKKLENILKNYTEIEIDLNIDGIPLFKSSRVQLWPILAKVVNIKENIDVFAVGIYLSNHKPSCASEFLHEFLNEFNFLKERFFLNGKKWI